MSVSWPEPIAQWLSEKGYSLLPFQEDAAAAVCAGRSGLIAAPTGSGKTLALLLPVIAEWLTAGEDRRTLIWITPLRALSQSLQKAATELATDLRLPVRVSARTGDTPQSERKRQIAALPDILITTPESLHLLISYPGSRIRFSRVGTIVVDEWHDLMGTKRGALVELGIAAVRSAAPDVRCWGLSATLSEPRAALDLLLGGGAPDVEVIEAPSSVPFDFEIMLPESVELFPWAGHLGLSLAGRVSERLRTAASALLFTNTRYQAEAWVQRLLELLPEEAGRIAIHHGALSDTERHRIEDGLRAGTVRICVCTSSLELGVDFPEVELVVQVGSPKAIDRLIQRAGRAAHVPGGRARLLFVPTHSLELLDAEAARRALARGVIEPRSGFATPPLDVLLQFLTTRACGDGFTRSEITDELSRTAVYRPLKDDELDWAIDFLLTGGATLRAYDEYRRIKLVDGRFIVANETARRRHRMCFGVIPSDDVVKVRHAKGRSIGSVEETFIAGLRSGDTFLLGGKALELVQVRDMVAFVRAGRSGNVAIPRWRGGTLPLSTSLAAELRALLREISGPGGLELAPAVLRPLLAVQGRWSAIPSGDRLVIEQARSRLGHHLFLYPLEGRFVHESIAYILAHRIAEMMPLTLTFAVNDYGLELVADRPLDQPAAVMRELLDPRSARETLLERLDLNDLERRAFREVAKIAGLTFQGYPGSRKAPRQLQASASLIYDVLRRYEPAHPLVGQARREVRSRRLDLERLDGALARLFACPFERFDTKRFTPFAFPLVVETMRDKVSSVSLGERIAKLRESLERQAGSTGRRSKSGDHRGEHA